MLVTDSNEMPVCVHVSAIIQQFLLALPEMPFFEVPSQLMNAHRVLPLNVLLTLQLGLCSTLLHHPPQLLCFFLQEPEPKDQADSAFHMLIFCDKTCH